MPSKALRNTVVLSGIAAGATGAVVAGGVASASSDQSGGSVIVAAQADIGSTILGGDLPDREQQVSRSDRREVADPTKQATLETTDSASNGYSRSEDLSREDPRDIARALMPEFGFDSSQFSCLDSLYESESGWDLHADNPTSSAYGIPQALTQTHDLPAGYMTSAEVQIRWGLGYIEDTYGTPCGAWSFKQGNNWY